MANGLPWLKDNCAILERTAQLYMRLAKNRTAIEEQIRNGVADLTLNEAAALLMLTSDVRKLLNFAKDFEHLSGDELIERCIAEGVGLIHTPNYDPFEAMTEAETLEWQLFTVFQSYDGTAGRSGGEPQRVADHVEYILQRPFQNVSEWLGEEGDKWRKTCGTSTVSEQFKTAWAAFLAERRDSKLTDVVQELETLQKRFEQERGEGRICSDWSPRRKRVRSRR